MSGSSDVGGIAGRSYFISNCVNYGAVSGGGNVGGIMGSGYRITNCYNTASVAGESNLGGIAGGNLFSSALTVANCYNIGQVTCTVTGNNAGAVVGSDGAVWGKDTITGCYYLKTASVNASLFGCGGVTSAEMEPSGFYARSAAELKSRNTYEDWDFDTMQTFPPSPGPAETMPSPR